MRSDSKTASETENKENNKWTSHENKEEEPIQPVREILIKQPETDLIFLSQAFKRNNVEPTHQFDLFKSTFVEEFFNMKT